jgi:hypothetical protein
MKGNKSKGICEGCRAECCRYVALEIDKPTCKRDYDNIRWYLLHENVSVFVDNEGSWNIEFVTPCEKLGADGYCEYYLSRPRICREHGVERTCEFHSDTEPHRLRFENEKEFIAYLESRGVDWQWKKPK